MNCLDLSIDSEEDFLNAKYNAVVVQPEALNSAMGQKVLYTVMNVIVNFPDCLTLYLFVPVHVQ